MTEERKARSMRITEEVWNRGNVDAYEELVAADVIRHQTPMADVVGLDALKQYVLDIRSAYSDFTVQTHDLIFDGDVSAGRFTIEGVHSGTSPSFPIPPTGKRVKFTGALISRWEGDRIVEEWVYNDYLGLLQQLGVVPAPS